jgi:hypothetical protein
MKVVKVRITDQRVAGEELTLEIEQDEDYSDEIMLDKDQAWKVIEFWESSTEVGGRGSYDLSDDGILMLAEVASVGDEIEMMAWYITDLDYGLDDFPSTTLEYEVVTQDSPGSVTDPEAKPERRKKFSELRSYPGMNGISMTLKGGDDD